MRNLNLFYRGLFHGADHFIYVTIRVCDDGLGFTRCHISEAFYIGFVFLLYDFVPFFSFFIGEVASVLAHNFIIWIYGFFRILFPFRIKHIRLCEFKYCYLILLCSRIGEPSLECITIFGQYVAFKADALAISLISLSRISFADVSISSRYESQVPLSIFIE